MESCRFTVLLCWSMEACIHTFSKGVSAYIHLQMWSIYIYKGLFCLYTLAKGISAYIHVTEHFDLYTFTKGFSALIFSKSYSAYIHLQSTSLCQYTFAKHFSANIHLQRAFLPIYICKRLFCRKKSRFNLRSAAISHISLQPLNVGWGKL